MRTDLEEWLRRLERQERNFYLAALVTCFVAGVLVGLVLPYLWALW